MTTPPATIETISQATISAVAPPSVCCIMLTRDRLEYARRAVECFRSQTYPEKKLLVYDTAKWPAYQAFSSWPANALYFHAPRFDLAIGALRNEATQFAIDEGESDIDIVIHWDDDDWSHPNRIIEQVELLQFTGCDCVGYREMLFWRDTD